MSQAMLTGLSGTVTQGLRLSIPLVDLISLSDFAEPCTSSLLVNSYAISLE